MYILLAFASAFFAGITSILVKVGIDNVDSHVATALRTVVVVVFSWSMVFIVGSQNTLSEISPKSYLFLVLSGISTGASWLCYFRALQLGNVNKVVPIDKSSTIMTMILAFIFLREPLTLSMIIGIIGIGLGTYLMIKKSNLSEEKVEVVKNDYETELALGILDDSIKTLENKWLYNVKSYIKLKSWIVYALMSAVFAALTSILAKVGIENVESNLGTAIRTIIVLIMAWLIVFITKKNYKISNIDKKSLIFIGLSGIATGLSWICYYKALQLGKASIVVPIDKLSILVTVLFAYLFLKEKISKRAMLGLILLVVGTLSLLVKI